MSSKRGKAKKARGGPKEPRPVLIQDCDSVEDHEGHRWRFSEEWPEGVFWWCRGRDNEEMRQGVIDTQKWIDRARKQDKGDRARHRRARRLFGTQS